MTQAMGGTPMKFEGDDVVAATAAFAREYGITHVVIGRSRRPWYRRWFRGSVLDRLLSAIPDVDVPVVGRG